MKVKADMFGRRFGLRVCGSAPVRHNIQVIVRCNSRKSLVERLRENDEAYRLELIRQKQEAFKTTFPEIAELYENERIRDALLDCEDITWPRGNTFRDCAREPLPTTKAYLRRCVKDILEKEDDLVTDDVAAFLEAYLFEKKAF